MSDRRALFLDRDGVINLDHGYVHRIEDFQFVDGIFDLVVAAVRLEYFVIVVTNQAGIGRGYYSEEEFMRLTEWMVEQVARKSGRIDGVYHCPYHPEANIVEYKKYSEFRKPNPGMILLAARDFSIDLTRSLLVGDKQSDIDAGIAAGVGKNLLYSPGTSQVDGNVIGSLHDAIAFLGGSCHGNELY